MYQLSYVKPRPASAEVLAIESRFDMGDPHIRSGQSQERLIGFGEGVQ